MDKDVPEEMGGAVRKGRSTVLSHSRLRRSSEQTKHKQESEWWPPIY